MGYERKWVDDEPDQVGWRWAVIVLLILIGSPLLLILTLALTT